MTPLAGTARLPLSPLFFVSFAAVGFEIALTRYFAIASWSEYGYWVISIAMVGFCASGVVLSLFKDVFERHATGLLRWLPTLLIVAVGIGYYFVTVNPFNPLELQNPRLFVGQLWNIGAFYLALFPFFFGAGFYVGLYFISASDRIPAAYGADLAGAGIGALCALLLMFVVPPFLLTAALVPALLAAALRMSGWPDVRGRPVFLACLLIAVVIAEWFAIALQRADFNEYKPIYAPLHVQGNRVVSVEQSPRGLFMVLDNFTERLDIDISSNAGQFGVKEAPRALGLYNDGLRVTGLPRERLAGTPYTIAALDTLPYLLRPAAQAWLIGTRGGFRVAEVSSLAVRSIRASEPDETLHRLVADRAPWTPGPSIRYGHENPLVVARQNTGAFDVIDVAADFLGQTDANKYVYTVEGIAALLASAKPDGLVSIPVSIREFTVHATKLVDTVRAALVVAGAREPFAHMVVYRSAWNARILASRTPIRPADIDLLARFCSERSFDTPHFPGIDPAQVQVWNDLPQVSFDDASVSRQEKATDALMDDVQLLRTNPAELRGQFFDVTPATYDRPFFWSVLRLSGLDRILPRIEIVPREEIGALINLAVLGQALVLALVLAGLPVLRWRSHRPSGRRLARSLVYFGGLGLGFLLIEIYLIEKTAFWLNDRTYGFSIVLTAMLLFSGYGSYLSGRFGANPRMRVTLAIGLVIGWVFLCWMGFDRLLIALFAWPFWVKCLLIAVMIAPVAVALGVPFPAGLSAYAGEHSRFLPWAWSLNGGFSVIATPLANLVAISFGYNWLLIGAGLLYGLVALSFPEPDQ